MSSRAPASEVTRSESAAPPEGPRPLPPGPRGLPLVGNIPAIVRLGMPAFLRQVHQQYGELVRMKIGGRTMILLGHPDHIRHVLFDNRANYWKGPTYDNFRLLGGNGLVSSEGEFWKRQRRMAAPAFHAEAISALVQLMVDATLDMRHDWEARVAAAADGVARLDLHDEMTRLTLRIVGESLFGQDLSSDSALSTPAFSVALRAVVERGNTGVALPLWIPTPSNVRLRRALRTLDRLVYTVIERQRAAATGGGRLLEMFMHAVDEETGQRMDDRQLRDEIITMYVAGHETTALALTWAWHLLSHHPEVTARLEAEVDAVLGGRPPEVKDLPRLKYTRMVLEEAMRLYPPIWSIARDVRADDVIDGYRIPAGSVVLLSQYVVHHRSDLWPQPDRFDPERFEPEAVKQRHRFAYFPFSAGPRVCIGNTFSLIEGTLILAIMCQRHRVLPVLGPDVPADIQVTYRPRGGLPVKVEARSESPLPVRPLPVPREREG
jgi:cytochrome P450